jgi:para-aminobenzoate synthetase / 4-amino-4-deoxychorismate lyase
MKGTIGRGFSAQEDLHFASTLQKDDKNRAENLMIVDLLRNDLSMICEVGSVKVPHLFETTTYETLIQMTSSVSGTLLPNISYRQLFEALFPCGSVTGAPKLRAMQHIKALEIAPRGVYCGSIGYISPHQESVFNVAIRTLSLRQDTLEMGIGSGIVWDSKASEEYAECLLKAQFLYA